MFIYEASKSETEKKKILSIMFNCWQNQKNTITNLEGKYVHKFAGAHSDRVDCLLYLI